jgi:potassium efflux system protein
MKWQNRSPILYILILFLCLPVLSGQSFLNPIQQNNTTKADTVKVKVEPIPLNNINNQSTQAFTMFTQLSQLTLLAVERLNIKNEVDTLISRANLYLADNAGLEFENMNYRELDALSSTLQILNNDITDIQDRINNKLKVVQNGVSELSFSKKRWNLTSIENIPEETPEAIIRRINNVVSRNDSISELLASDIDFLLTQSDNITGLEIKLDLFQNMLAESSRISSTRIFRRDMPAIWALSSVEDSTTLAIHWQKFKVHIEEDARTISRNYSGRLILVFSMFILLIIIAYWLKATIKDLTIKENKVVLSLYVNEIFKKPIEVSMLMGLYLLWLLIPEMPPTFASAIAIISVYAILRIAFDILRMEYKKFLLGFAIAYVLFRFYGLFYDQHFLGRCILLGAQVITCIFLIRFIQSRSLFYSKKRTAFNYIMPYISITYLILLILAFIGNVLGIISFSEFLSGGVIKSGFMIFTTYVGFHISAGLIYLILASSLFNNSNIIKQQSAYIFSKTYNVLRVFFILSWILIALDQFKIRDVVVEWGRSLLTNEIPIGKDGTISFMNIILFVFVIWLSMFISKFVRHILQEEVFPRVKVERGMPGTITMLIRISLITIGFLLAAAAAGMNLSSLTIILGAFSVGIGFGLQNIFNNLVSGLILAFERPIKEGDIVEVNTLLGTVKKIGIRSSIVRTFSGAEVIVPNGDLISNELINWTLSDQYRRADIRIGVAYGTKPELVIDLLLKIANENARVIKRPVPQAFFIDFGESSLDFRLLAWVDQDYRIEVESEIRVDINRSLNEAGIEIPFPQTDLHVKSVTDDAAKNLK